MKIESDKEFNSIMLRDIKLDISNAFILMEANMREILFCKHIDEKQALIIKKKAEQMKEEINTFINAQVEMTVKRTGLPIETDSPNFELQGERQNLPP